MSRAVTGIPPSTRVGSSEVVLRGAISSDATIVPSAVPIAREVRTRDAVETISDATHVARTPIYEGQRVVGIKTKCSCFLRDDRPKNELRERLKHFFQATDFIL
jgi:hypothetical protein